MNDHALAEQDEQKRYFGKPVMWLLLMNPFSCLAQTSA